MKTLLRDWFLKQTSFFQIVLLTAVIGITFTGIGYTAYQSMLFDGNGNLRVVVYSGSSAVTPSTIANEGATISTGATNVLEVLGFNYLYNGTNWVRNLLTAGTTGSAVPAAATYIGGKGSSGNLNGAIMCDSYAKYDASTSGSTQLVALSGSTIIYICGYSIHVGGTATNVKLVYGTGSNCATSPSDVTPAWQLLANAGRVIAPTIWAGLKTASAQALCLNASAANAVQAEVWYTQF